MVIGASAGGVEALSKLVSLLPPDFPAAVVVVLHVSRTSVLPEILDRAGSLPVSAATNRAPLRPGTVTVAIPNHHVVVRHDHVETSAGPRENGHRPSLDVTLRSLAECHGPRGIGVILSGTRDDGTAGLASVKLAGGTALVQDPAEAMYSGMPESAMRQVEVDAVMPVAGLAAEIDRLVRLPPRAAAAPHRGGPVPEQRSTRFTCPACGGVLWQEHEPVEAYACSVGHRYSPASLEAEHGHQLETALWEAARMLGDRAELLRSMSVRATGAGNDRSAARYLERAREAEERARLLQDLVRDSVLDEGSRTDDDADEDEVAG